jgi:hypothetical protein
MPEIIAPVRAHYIVRIFGGKMIRTEVIDADGVRRFSGKPDLFKAVPCDGKPLMN